MVHVSKIAAGMVAYADTELVPRVSGSLKAWGIGAAVMLVCDRLLAVLQLLSQNRMVSAMGLVDGEMVDVDAVYQAVKKYAERQTATVEVPFVGCITFTSSDVDALYRAIKQA